jgi:hypothetical protein
MKKISIKFVGVVSPLANRQALLGSLAFLAMVVPISPAIADEVWSSDYGNVIYQADRGKTAIWTYGDSARGSLFIEGLAGKFKARDTYYGYWSQSKSKVKCETFREGRDGKATYYWGNFRIKFIESEFPSRWSATFGYCNQPLNLSWRAYPIVGDGLTEPLKLP